MSKAQEHMDRVSKAAADDTSGEKMKELFHKAANGWIEMDTQLTKLLGDAPENHPEVANPMCDIAMYLKATHDYFTSAPSGD